MATEMTRHARLELKYRDKDIGGYCTNADYTDHGHGQLDEICARLEDRDFNWQGPWIPSKGDSIEAIIHCHNWFVSGDHLTLTCGKFEIQEVSLTGQPDMVEIRGVSIKAAARKHLVLLIAFLLLVYPVIKLKTATGLLSFSERLRHYPLP